MPRLFKPAVNAMRTVGKMAPARTTLTPNSAIKTQMSTRSFSRSPYTSEELKGINAIVGSSMKAGAIIGAGIGVISSQSDDLMPAATHVAMGGCMGMSAAGLLAIGFFFPKSTLAATAVVGAAAATASLRR